MPANCLENCFTSNRLILTEGAVGQRLEREFSLTPDDDIMYASLLYSTAGRKALAAIYQSYLQVAQDYSLPILLLTNTRRANKERVLRSNYRDKNMMHDYAQFLREVAANYTCETYIGGIMGCRGDAYSGTQGMPTDEAIEFHTWQMEQFSQGDIDFLLAGIMPSLPEIIGMARVMQQSGLPYIISLMINSKGTLLDGTSIHDAITSTDAAVKRPPLCYMTNCVHPLILKQALLQKVNQTTTVKNRFCGIQANAACLTPEELDGCAVLQTSTPAQLAEDFYTLHQAFPLTIYGGCCGTDASHIR